MYHKKCDTNLIQNVYCEWVEDLGLSPADILLRLLEKRDEEIEYLKRDNSFLRNRLSNHEMD